MKKLLSIALLTLGLCACGAEQKAAQEMAVSGEAASPVAVEEYAPAPMADASAGRAADGAPTSAPSPAGPTPVLYLAYSYDIGLELPAPRFAAAVAGHVEACQKAGPRLCQIIDTTQSGDPKNTLYARVHLRGEPAWLATFMADVAKTAEDAGGRVRTRATHSEDLTRAIVDTEARLAAMTTMRARLRELLARRPGKISDLLEIERELARVQGEIDSMQSTLAVMRTRVAMSELAIDYESRAQPLRAEAWAPLGQAFANFLSVVAQSLATIVLILAALLPWAFIVWGASALVLWIRKRRGGRLFGRPAPKPAAPQAPPGG